VGEPRQNYSATNARRISGLHLIYETVSQAGACTRSGAGFDVYKPRVILIYNDWARIFELPGLAEPSRSPERINGAMGFNLRVVTPTRTEVFVKSVDGNRVVIKGLGEVEASYSREDLMTLASMLQGIVRMMNTPA